MTMFRAVAAIAALAGSLNVTAPAQSAAFFAWEVSGLSFGDTLNVRRWPSAQSQKRAAYPAGTALSLTGKCKDAPHMLDQIAHLSPAAQQQAVRYMWCEIWHEPAQNGTFEPGWIYMKYARPLGH